MKKSSFDYRAVGISFRRAATQILKSLSNAPLSLDRGAEQARQGLWRVGSEDHRFKGVCLLGCPGLSFKANLPFNGMRPFFAALLKETPADLFALFSNS